MSHLTDHIARQGLVTRAGEAVLELLRNEGIDTPGVVLLVFGAPVHAVVLLPDTMAELVPPILRDIAAGIETSGPQDGIYARTIKGDGGVVH